MLLGTPVSALFMAGLLDLLFPPVAAFNQLKNVASNIVGGLSAKETARQNERTAQLESQHYQQMLERQAKGLPLKSTPKPVETAKDLTSGLSSFYNPSTNFSSPMDTYQPPDVNQIVDNLINNVTSFYKKQQDEYNSKASDFDKNNPFNFDQVLADQKTKVGTRLDPYYEQTLGDFMHGIESTKSRSLEDERRLLGDIQKDVDQYQGDAKLNLDKVLDATRQGAADAGMYFSGKTLAAEGEQRAQEGEGVNKFLDAAEQKKQGINRTTGRTLEDLAFKEGTGKRDINTEKQYNIESQAIGETNRLRNEREFSRQQVLGAYPGVNPMKFEDFSYNLLGA